MKVFVIAAQTADGFVGRDSHHFVDWTGQEDIKHFVKLTKQAGVVVMGSHTFETIQSAGKRLPGRRIIVLTSRPDEVTGERVETTNEAPEELITRLAGEGVEAVAICGGSQVYSQFMLSGVVDELYLSITPRVFGTGLPLFTSAMDVKLALLEAAPLGDGTVVMHYTTHAQ